MNSYLPANLGLGRIQLQILPPLAIIDRIGIQRNILILGLLL